MKKNLVLLFVVAIFLTSPAVLEASRTNLWEFNSIKAWLQGDFEGTGLTSDGAIKPTLATNSTDLNSRIIWEAQSFQNNTLVGASFPSALYLIDNSQEITVVHKTNDLGFTSLGKLGENIYAGATPSGKIYKLNKERETVTQVATIPDSYVWTMKSDTRNEELIIGTGPNGNLYRLNSEEEITKIASIPGDNIISMTYFDGSLYLGSDAGGLYNYKNKSINTIYGFSQGEISSLSSTDKYLFAGVNKRKGSEPEEKKKQKNSDLARQLKQKSLQDRMGDNETESTSSPDTQKAFKKQAPAMMIERIRNQTRERSSGLFAGLSGSLVYRMVPPKKMNVIYNDPKEIVHDLATDGKNLFVATGGQGRLYKVKPDFTRVAHFKTNQRMILDIKMKGKSLSTITTGEGGTFQLNSDKPNRKTSYRSKILDAQLLAQWGQIKSLGNGHYKFRTRSGNTPSPDSLWTEWSQWKDPPRTSIASEPGRFLQFEVKFTRPTAHLRELELSFLVPNQRPRITDLSISPNPVQKRFLQTRETHQKNGQKPGRSNQNSHRSRNNGSLKERTVSWEIVDPDGDPTKSRLFYRPLDGEKWISFTGENFINEDEYTIDLMKLSDGRYELKLETSDKHFNDPDHGFSSNKEISPLLVDNTQPAFESLSVTKERIKFTALDSTSRIILAQYRVNGNDWRTLWPEDNIFDQRQETFELELDSNLNSGDYVEFRLMDEGGNRALTRRTIP